MKVGLHITYTTGGRCFTVAEIQDHSLLVQAAKFAMEETQLCLWDAEKSGKLTQLLKILIPELEEKMEPLNLGNKKTIMALATRVLREYGVLIYLGGPSKGAFYRPVETIEIERKIQHWLGKEARPARIRQSVNLLRRVARLESSNINRVDIWKKVQKKLDELSQDC